MHSGTPSVVTSGWNMQTQSTQWWMKNMSSQYSTAPLCRTEKMHFIASALFVMLVLYIGRIVLCVCHIVLNDTNLTNEDSGLCFGLTVHARMLHVCIGCTVHVFIVSFDKRRLTWALWTARPWHVASPPICWTRLLRPLKSQNTTSDTGLPSIETTNPSCTINGYNLRDSADP